MNRAARHVGRAGAVAALALALAACDHPWVEKKRIELGGWTQEKMLADGWLKAKPEPRLPAYCYDTLGDPDCYADPVPGQSVRRTIPDE